MSQRSTLIFLTIWCCKHSKSEQLTNAIYLEVFNKRFNVKPLPRCNHTNDVLVSPWNCKYCSGTICRTAVIKLSILPQRAVTP